MTAFGKMLTAAAFASMTEFANAQAPAVKNVVLVHGAFADGSGSPGCSDGASPSVAGRRSSLSLLWRPTLVKRQRSSMWALQPLPSSSSKHTRAASAT